MKITIKNIWNISEYTPKRKAILISIVDDPNFNLDFYNKYINVLKLNIDDIDTCLTSNTNLNNYKIFNKNNYNEIINFVDLNTKQNIDEIVIHCNAGISRSPAIGIGLCKYLNLNKEFNEMIKNKKYIPNLNILSYFCDIEDLKKQRLKDINEKINKTISFSLFDLIE